MTIDKPITCVLTIPRAQIKHIQINNTFNKFLHIYIKPSLNDCQTFITIIPKRRPILFRTTSSIGKVKFNLTISFQKLTSTIQIAQKATMLSAGYDFYSPVTFTIPPKQIFKLPPAIKAEFPPGFYGIIRDRYSIVITKQILILAGTID